MSSQSFSPKSLFSRSQLIEGFKFLISTLCFYTFFWLLIRSIDLYSLKMPTAVASNGLLHLLGVASNVAVNAEPSVVVKGVTAQITNLCAGDLEIALLSAIILSTHDREWKNRIIGVIGGLATILIVNPVRIALVLAVGYYSSWKWADFTHDVLFRLTLIVIIVGYYAAWYYWSGKKEELKKDKRVR